MPASVRNAVCQQRPFFFCSRDDVNGPTVSQETGEHELGAVAHGVDGTVLDDESLIRGQEGLQGSNDAAQVGLVAGVVHGPLRIEHVVQGDQLLGLVHGAAAHATQLLHVGADAEQETEMHAEGTDVGAGLAADPEDTEVALVVKLDELALVDGPDSELALDGRDQRRALEQGARERLERARELGLAAGQLVVEADDADVFLPGALLRLDETSRAVDADDQASRHLGIQSATVASLFRAVASACQQTSPHQTRSAFSSET